MSSSISKANSIGSATEPLRSNERGQDREEPQTAEAVAASASASAGESLTLMLGDDHDNDHDDSAYVPFAMTESGSGGEGGSFVKKNKNERVEFIDDRDRPEEEEIMRSISAKKQVHNMRNNLTPRELEVPQPGIHPGMLYEEDKKDRTENTNKDVQMATELSESEEGNSATLTPSDSGREVRRTSRRGQSSMPVQQAETASPSAPQPRQHSPNDPPLEAPVDPINRDSEFYVEATLVPDPSWWQRKRKYILGASVSVVFGILVGVILLMVNDRNVTEGGNVQGTNPTGSPSVSGRLSLSPSKYPSRPPNPEPSASPSKNPTNEPTPAPTANPTFHPTAFPTHFPTRNPTPIPTPFPTRNPTPIPTPFPTRKPTPSPTAKPTQNCDNYKPFSAAFNRKCGSNSMGGSQCKDRCCAVQRAYCSRPIICFGDSTCINNCLVERGCT